MTAERSVELVHVLRTLLSAGVDPDRALAAIECEAGGGWLDPDDPVTGVLIAGPRALDRGEAARLAARRLEVQLEVARAGRRAVWHAAGPLFGGALAFVISLFTFWDERRSILNSMNIEVPELTRQFVRLSEAAQAWGAPCVVGILVAVGMAAYVARGALLRAVRRLPIACRVARRWDEARLARDLGSLLATGLSALRALDVIAARRCEEEAGRVATRAAGFITRGESLARALARSGWGAGLVAMVEAGEDYGTADRVLLAAAAERERAVADLLWRIGDVAFPAAMIALALAALFCLMAGQLPMIKIINNVG